MDTLFVFHLSISGSDVNNSHPLNKLDILTILFVSKFKNSILSKLLQPANI